MDIELTRLFVKVVQFGSFSRAAESLRMPKSTVSKAISRLERETGTRLMVRTTRSLRLTAAGQAFYDTCLGPIQTLEEAQKSLFGQDQILSGLIRLTAPEDMGNEVLAPAIGELARRHPGLSFELLCTDQVVDLVREGFDFAIRLGRLRASGLKAKKIGELILVPVASPSYLKMKPRISRPADLGDGHELLALTVGSGMRTWVLRSRRGTENLELQARISSNQMSSLLRAARAGAGVALVPSFLCREDLASGRLVRVLPEWSSPGLPVSLVSPLASTSTARLKIVSEALIEAVRGALVV